MIGNIVRGKTVIIVGNSPSVKWLVENREIFRDKSYIFVSMNNWFCIENDFLRPISKEFSILAVGNNPNLICAPNNVENPKFTHRKSNNCFITSYWPSPEIYNPARSVDFFSKYNTDKVCFVPKPCKKNSQKGIFSFPKMDTLSCLVCILLQCNIERIFIFGCEGGRKGCLFKGCHYKCICNCNKLSKYKKITDGIVPQYPKIKGKINKLIKQEVSRQGNNFKRVFLVANYSTYNFCKMISYDDVKKTIEGNRLVEQYNIIHKKSSEYGIGGVGHADRILSLIKKYSIKTVLDFGCGKGKLVDRLRQENINAIGYDPSVPKFKHKTQCDVDMIVCTDVLEHIYEIDLMTVYEEMNAWSPKVMFFIICNRLAHKVLPDGTNAHKTVRPASWWLSNLKRIFIGYKITTRPAGKHNSIVTLVSKKG